MKFCTNMDRKRAREIYRAIQNPFFTLVLGVLFIFYAVQIFSPEVSFKFICKILVILVLIIVCFIARDLYYIERICPKSGKSRNGQYMQTVIFEENDICIGTSETDERVKLEYQRVLKCFSSKHYYIFMSKGEMMFFIEKAGISAIDKEKFIKLLNMKMPQVKLPGGLPRSVYDVRK